MTTDMGGLEGPPQPPALGSAPAEPWRSSVFREASRAYLEAIGVRKAFDVEGGPPTIALDDVTFTMREGEFLAILGPSGCGKSTLLNIIAGFLRPSAGRVLVDGRAVTGPGADRGVVFQEYVLFPWLTVTGNVEFGLRLKGAGGAERRAIVARYLQL